MKSSKKAGGSTRAMSEREREQVAARLNSAVYQKLAEAAATNRCSMSAEVERRIVQSFEPRFATHSLEAFGAHVMAAFRMGGQLVAQDRPIEEWIKDEVAFDRAVALAVEALLSYRPKPLRDAAGNPIKVLGVHTTGSVNPADKGKLHFVTPEDKNEG